MVSPSPSWLCTSSSQSSPFLHLRHLLIKIIDQFLQQGEAMLDSVKRFSWKFFIWQNRNMKRGSKYDKQQLQICFGELCKSIWDLDQIHLRSRSNPFEISIKSISFLKESFNMALLRVDSKSIGRLQAVSEIIWRIHAKCWSSFLKCLRVDLLLRPLWTKGRPGTSYPRWCWRSFRRCFIYNYNFYQWSNVIVQGTPKMESCCLKLFGDCAKASIAQPILICPQKSDRWINTPLSTAEDWFWSTNPRKYVGKDPCSVLHQIISTVSFNSPNREIHLIPSIFSTTVMMRLWCDIFQSNQGSACWWRRPSGPERPQHPQGERGNQSSSF